MADEMDEKLFRDILNQCRPGFWLSHFFGSVRKERFTSEFFAIRDRLEKYERNVRKVIVSRKDDDCAPLFCACETGNLEMVEYLISTCDADVEQRGCWCDDEGTPLWIAAILGRTPIIECLMSHGSQVNALSDSGSTPVLAACYWSPSGLGSEITDAVECLVKHGADIDRADNCGRTCLMVTICDVELCEFLLKNGADVDARDRENATALHYAIETEMLDTVQLLLGYGADMTLMRSVDNSDALQTACLKGFWPIFDYLVEHGSYSPGRLADANELMGSRCFLDTEKALKYWRIAIEIRNSNTVDGNPLAKTPSMPKRDYYRNASEFTTLDELNTIALDSDALKIQNLLIHERILGDHHRSTLDALHRTAVAYAQISRYQDCIVFWRRALEIGTANDSISRDTVADVAKCLVRVLYDLHEQIPLEEADPNRVNVEQSRFVDVVAIFKLLTSHLVRLQLPSEQVLAMCPAKRPDYDTILIYLTYLIDLLVKTARTSEAEDEVRALVRHLVNQNPTLTDTGDMLLHLCVLRHINIDSKYLPCDDDEQIFPNLEVTKLLLECEADVNARNEYGRTPLHIATCARNLSDQLVKLLLDHGAHLDSPDKYGSTPADKISMKPHIIVDLVKYTTLRCLAAQAIVKNEIRCPIKNDLPASVNQFLDVHRLPGGKKMGSSCPIDDEKFYDDDIVYDNIFDIDDDIYVDDIYAHI